MFDRMVAFWQMGPWSKAAVTVLLGAALAIGVGALFRTVLTRLTGRTETKLDDVLVTGLRTPVSVTVFAASVWYATHHFAMLEPMPYLLHGVLFSSLVAVWCFAVVQLSTFLLEDLNANVDRYALVTPRTLPLFKLVANLVVFGGGIYFFFLSWDIDVAGWLAGAGIVGIAFGFAAQDTLSNLIAGVFILADAPYQLGDTLQLESGVRGKVTQIGMRTTRLVTLDDVEIIVPNAIMANSTIVNESGGPWVKHRVAAVVGVAYDTDVARARGLMIEVLEGVGGVATHPRPRVQFRAFGASSLELHLLLWVHEPELKWSVLDVVHDRILTRFREEGIEIPFDQVDLNLRGGEGLDALASR